MIFTAATASQLKLDAIELLTGPQLAQAHNQLAALLGRTPIAKFKDRPTGIKRVAELVPVAQKFYAANAVADEALRGPRRSTSISARGRELLLQGLDNEEVYQTLHAELGLPPEKKHYVRWIRSDLKRKGKL